ncbi:hypothetical protein ID741_001384 [Enterococcus sp. AZ103]
MLFLYHKNEIVVEKIHLSEYNGVEKENIFLNYFVKKVQIKKQILKNLRSDDAWQKRLDFSEQETWARQ